MLTETVGARRGRRPGDVQARARQVELHSVGVSDESTGLGRDIEKKKML